MLRLFVVLLSVVFMGCFGFNDVTKDDVSDMGDCYEGTVVVDDRYGIVLDKDCMDAVLLSAGQKIAIDTEAIENAEEVRETAAEATETEPVVTETEVAQQYPCPIEDRGDWTLLTTLLRDDFQLNRFRVHNDAFQPINQAYVDQKDFLFVIYKPSVPLPPSPEDNFDRTLGSWIHTRYYLENPGLLYNTALVPHVAEFYFVDPNALWFQHWAPSDVDRSNAGFSVTFEAQRTEDQKFIWHPQFITSLAGNPGDSWSPKIRMRYQLNIYVR